MTYDQFSMWDYASMAFWAWLYASACAGLVYIGWGLLKNRRAPDVHIPDDVREQWERDRFQFTTMKSLNRSQAKGFKAGQSRRLH